MSNDTSVFCCTHCGARFKGPATAQKVRCVKCQKVVERTLSSSPPPIRKPSAGSPQATKASSSNAPGPPPQPAPVFGDTTRQKTRLILSRSPTLSLDELKSVKDAKVEITFDE